MSAAPSTGRNFDATHPPAGTRRWRVVNRPRGSSTLESGLGLEIPFPGALLKLLLWPAIASALVGMAVFLSYPAATWQNLAGAVAVDCGGTVVLLIWLGRTAEGKLAVNPLTGMLSLYALRRLLGLIYVVGQGSSLSSPFSVVPAGAYIAASAKAEWVTLVGSAAFCVGWVVGQRRQWMGRITAPPKKHFDRQLWVVYLIGLVFFLADWLSRGALSQLGNFITITSGLAYGAIFALLAFSRDYGVRGRLRMVTYVALIPLEANVLTFGMKSAFFYALLPVGAAYLLRKPARGLALSALGVLFLLVFVYPYVQEYREANWGNAPGASVGQVAEKVQQNLAQEGVKGTVQESWEEFELRFGGVNEAGAVIYFADSTGLMGSFFIKNLIYGFIPRLIWPGKPSWDPSGWFTAYLAGESSYTPGITSTALHIGPELYWMYGWPGTFFGLLLLGFYYRKVSDWLLKKGYTNPLFLAAWYSFLVFVTFIEEVRYNGAILSPFILLANALVISWGLKLLLPRPPAWRSRKVLQMGEATERL